MLLISLRVSMFEQGHELDGGDDDFGIFFRAVIKPVEETTVYRPLYKALHQFYFECEDGKNSMNTRWALLDVKRAKFLYFQNCQNTWTMMITCQTVRMISQQFPAAIFTRAKPDQ